MLRQARWSHTGRDARPSRWLALLPHGDPFGGGQPAPPLTDVENQAWGVVLSREVTVRVPLNESLDLLERPARACVGFISGGGPRIEPARLRYEDGRYLIGIEPDNQAPDPSTEVVLIVDDGVLFFELRAVYVRGIARPLPPSSRENLHWFEVDPSLVSSWNYGRMRWKRASG